MGVVIAEQKFIILKREKNDTHAKMLTLTLFVQNSQKEGERERRREGVCYMNVKTFFQNIFIDTLKYKCYSSPSL